MTFRLACSLPVGTVDRLKREHAEVEKRILGIENRDEQRKARREWGAEYFRRFDEFLDRAVDGASWLRQDSIAAKMVEIIHVQDGKSYDLLAYCLMPNHVHLLAKFWQLTTVDAEVDVRRSSDRYRSMTAQTSKRDQRTKVRYTTGGYVVSDVLKKLKGVSAYECNKLLHRRGAFWQHESYDHVVRNLAEMERTAWYILNNPVKAGLCRHWRDWKWTYLKDGVIEL